MPMKSSGRCLPPVVIIPLLLLLLSCSTYFNTFYNAESAFNEAYKIHARAMRDFPDSIVTEPPADARTKYDRAIEKASKVLEVYTKDIKWHDDAYFLLGKSCFYEKDMGKAVRWFRQLQDEYPQSPFIPESQVYLAEAYIVDDKLAKAEETLKYAISRYPFLDKDQKLSLLLIEVAIRREGKSQAVGLIEQARLAARSEEKKNDLLLRAAELYMDLRQYDRAVALLRNAPRSKKFPAQSYRADRDLITCYVTTDSLQQALTFIETIQAKGRESAHFKELSFAKGEILERMNRLDEAIAVYKLVVGSTDTTLLKTDTSEIVSKALLELGLLYQKRKNDYQEAEKYYKLVTVRQVKDTAVAARANKRLKAMTTLKELRAALAARDTSMKRRTRIFKIGELFYYELDEPDSAYRQFLTIVNDTAVDTSGAVPKAFFAAAFIVRKDFKDTVRSDSLYKLLIAGFPGTDYARRAQEEMKTVLVTPTRKELAAEAFRSAEKKYLIDGDTRGAIQAFYDVYREYPNLDIASKSLFVAAWLTDNELEKKKVAKSLYEKICDRYPASMYCTKEAQPRLKAVRDTLEALRQERKKADIIAARLAGKKAPRAADTASAPAITGKTIDSLVMGGTVVVNDSGAASGSKPVPVHPPALLAPPGISGDSAQPYNPKFNPHGRMMASPVAPPVLPESLHTQVH
ncbi:MAG: tetratricopeptide repeat protein [Chitinispirillaceae bacterium]